ncbi:asparagine synthase C-terminal domain-containing protein [uncultured Thiodictyon sp.]|jgi:asparagine synthase (glutamine-hydrolysing)|uniref:asparagine synthase-related protein n=1 Tax=uncultured Thiodictyon sp. TaxID=1846217 RepID=UPI0026006581|nr:asparagine synthase C-terminal domain-containing protein [uncultured Thiodictyon sp.]
MTGPRLFGWLDPPGTASPGLATWCAVMGAGRAACDGPFALWCWPGERVRITESPAQVLAVSGVLFGGPAAPDAVAGRGDPDGHYLRVRWERAGRRLCLFRDDSASQDLYYRTLPGGGVAFSDDLDLLVTSPGGAPHLSRRGLHEYLRFLDIATPNTLYAGVRSPEPGVELIVEPNRAPRSAPRLPPPRPLVPQVLEEAATALDRLLDDAVRARMPAAGTVIAFLSGGVDSALIAALAAAAAPGRILAYTLGFEDSACDEAPIAARIAAHLGLPHRVLRPTMAEYRAAFDDWTAAISHPFADPAALPTLLAFRDARRLGAVALDGTGADELIGILPAPHRRKAVWLATLAPRVLRRAAARLCGALGPLAGLYPLVEFDDPQEFLIRWRGWPRRELERLCAEPVSLAHTRFYRTYRDFRPGQHFARFSRLMATQPDDRIHEASRLTGLAVRFPFFDARLGAFVRALPVAMRYPPAQPKRILKAALARRVPRDLWDQPKHGFDFPFTDFLALDDYALPRHYLSPERVRALSQAGAGLDPRVVAETLERLRAGGREVAFRVWALTVLSAWIENHWRRLG